MKLAEAFAKKTYKEPKLLDTVWQRQVSVTRAELNQLVQEIGYYVGVRVTPEDLAKKYRKEVNEYLESMDSAAASVVFDIGSEEFEETRKHYLQQYFVGVIQ